MIVSVFVRTTIDVMLRSRHLERAIGDLRPGDISAILIPFSTGMHSNACGLGMLGPPGGRRQVLWSPGEGMIMFSGSVFLGAVGPLARIEAANR